MQVVKQVGCCVVCPMSEIDWDGGYLNCGMLGYIAITVDFNPNYQVHMFCPWVIDPKSTLVLEIIRE